MPQDGKKMIFDRIQITENYFGDLCSEMSSITKKKARLRDKYDDLARILKGYADTVRYNETLFNGLSNYSKSCTLLADSKDMEVQRLQSKTINDMAKYEHVCRTARETLKHSLMQRGKEHLKQKNQQRNIEQTDSKPEENKMNNDFEMNLMKFERQKIDDIRRILLDLTMIQLKESVNSMNILTSMYKDIAAIDADKDLEEFEQKFLNKETNSLKPSNRSQSLSALTNTSQPLKRSNLSNSTMSLSSPNKDSDSNMKNGKKHSSNNESDDDDETSKTSEETTESEEELSAGSSQTKQSSSFYEEDDDDEAVRVHSINEIAKKKANRIAVPGKRAAPVPQVRFSKQISHSKN